MKTKFYAWLIPLTLGGHPLRAQFQLTPAINLVVANRSPFTGGSLSGRYVWTPRVATGLNVRYVPAINLAMVTLEGDYYLVAAKSVQPYIGLEVGLLGQYGDQTASRARAPGVIPKLGLQGKLSSKLDLQLTGGYAVAIHRGEALNSDSGWLLSLGLGFRFEGRN